MVLIAVFAFCSAAMAEVLPNRHFFLNVANDGGVKYDVDYTHYNVSPPPDSSDVFNKRPARYSSGYVFHECRMEAGRTSWG